MNPQRFPHGNGAGGEYGGFNLMMGGARRIGKSWTRAIEAGSLARARRERVDCFPAWETLLRVAMNWQLKEECNEK